MENIAVALCFPSAKHHPIDGLPFHRHFSHPCSWRRRSLARSLDLETAMQHTQHRAKHINGGRVGLGMEGDGVGGLGVYRLGCLHEQSQGVKQIILACVKAAARHKYACWSGPFMEGNEASSLWRSLQFASMCPCS